jgi:hypothetical protein
MPERRPSARSLELNGFAFTATVSSSVTVMPRGRPSSPLGAALDLIAVDDR